jgi:hypothetical protein
LYETTDQDVFAFLNKNNVKSPSQISLHNLLKKKLEDEEESKNNPKVVYDRIKDEIQKTDV